MDFWDLTVVIFRRWMISLPLLLLAIGATVAVALTAKPDYTMTSYVQFIPAKVAPTDNPVNAALRNPWNQLGLSTLGQASIYTTQDQGFLDSLKASNHTDNFTLTMTYPNPIVTVEVVGKTRAEARDTTELVISRLRTAAQSLQRQSNVQDGDVIPTQRLDQGQNLVASGGKVKRAIAAVAAAGLLIMIGGTVGFDALARRRSRRQSLAEAGDAPPSPATGAVNGKDPKGGAVADGEPAGRAARPPATAAYESTGEKPDVPVRAAPSASMERTAIVMKRSGSAVKRTSSVNGSRPPESATTYVSANAQGEGNGDKADAAPPATNGDASANPSDVRVVLAPKRVGGDSGEKSD